MEFEVVIGLEVHAQLLTKSKMFCSCASDYQNTAPNARVCPVCLGMPGVLPVINERAVEYTIMTGLALNCSIPEHTKFDRKNYPYPDLMKGYQISQYDMPLAKDGFLSIDLNGNGRKNVGITRVHLEEDVAKLFHREEPGSPGYSLADVNRAGVPLMEIVSEPDMRTPEEARQYLMKLRTIVRYLGVSTGNMEEGSFRCDANISLRPVGSSELLTRVEVKNMNSFRSVFRALEFEVDRQTKVLNDGGRIVQETRGWVDDKGITVSQRSKEHAHDYRYLPEPDLPPLVVDRQWVEELKRKLPELPDERKERFVSQYNLPDYDASLLTASKDTADYFEGVLKSSGLDGEVLNRRAKTVSNWMLGELARLINLNNVEITDISIQPEQMNELLDLVDDGTLNTSAAKPVLEVMFEAGAPPKKIIKERDMSQISDAQSMEPVVAEAISGNPNAVSDYLSGKETALKFLIGQVMKLTRGKANPGVVSKLLREKLESMRNS